MRLEFDDDQIGVIAFRLHWNEDRARPQGDIDIVIQNPDPHAWIKEVKLDRQGPGTMVDQLVNAIRSRIALSQLRVGDTLPSVRNMADSIGTTAATVSRAYQALAQEGLVQALTGVGTVIKDVQEIEASARSGITAAGLELVSKLIADLESIGFSTAEIVETLRVTAFRLELPTRRFRGLFVSAEYSSVRRFTDQLTEALGPLGVSVEPISIETLEGNPKKARLQLREADFVFTLLPYRRRLRKLDGTLGERVHLLLAELAFSTVEALLNISSDHKVVLITSETNRQTAAALLNPFCGPDKLAVPNWSPNSVDAFLAAAKQRNEVIVYTREMQDAHSGLNDASEAILLEFQLREDSLLRLREQIANDVARSDIALSSGIPIRMETQL